MKKSKALSAKVLVTPPQIVELRGQRVLLDETLAALYGVLAKRLNEQVKRNIERFPPDFMFQLTAEETESLRSQFATIKTAGRGRHRKYLPYAFTEQGVAMLSSVLTSERAVAVNIEIMRTFVRLRHAQKENQELTKRVDSLEAKHKEHDEQFKVVFVTLDELMEPAPTPPAPPRRTIGFQKHDDATGLVLKKRGKR